MDSECGGTGPEAVADASATCSADAGAGEATAATYCLEPGAATGKEAVVQGRDGTAAPAGVGTLDAAAARCTAGDVERTGDQGPASGPGGGTRSRGSAGSPTLSHASWSRAGDFFSHSADHGRGAAVCQLAQLGQLPGLESLGGFQRQEKAAGSDQQAREPIFTISPGGRRCQRRQRRQGSGPDVCPAEGPEAPRGGQSGRGPKA